MTQNDRSETVEFDLVQRITQQINRAVRSMHTEDPRLHPIILVNSVKNIIGDDRQSPSEILLDFTDRYLSNRQMRVGDDELLEKIQKEGLGLTVFVDDMETALNSKNKEEMEIQTIRQILVSNRSHAVLESLAELALLDFQKMGLFTLHWLRSYQFRHDQNLLWPYCRSMIHELLKADLKPLTLNSTNISTNDIMQHLQPQNFEQWGNLSAACRFISDEYIRTDSYKKSIVEWLAKKSMQIEFDHSLSEGLKQKFYPHGRLFIDHAEKFVQTLDIQIATEKIIKLESLRSLYKLSLSYDNSSLVECFRVLISEP